MRRLCLSDWDGTLRPGFILKDWLDHLSSEGIVQVEFAIACRQRIIQYQKGELPYNDLVVAAADMYASALKDASHNEVMLSAQRFVLKDTSNLFPFTQPLLTLLQRNNINTIIISGAPAEVFDAYRRILPFLHFYALKLRLNNSGNYTGDVVENHGIRQEKERVVNYFKSPSDDIFLALGNAPTDEPLFESARHAFLLQTDDMHDFVGRTTKVNPDSLLAHVSDLLTQQGGLI